MFAFIISEVEYLSSLVRGCFDNWINSKNPEKRFQWREGECTHTASKFPSKYAVSSCLKITFFEIK